MSSPQVSTLDLQSSQADLSQPSRHVEAPVQSIVHRPRRLRCIETLRRTVRENILRVEDLIYLLFVKHLALALTDHQIFHHEGLLLAAVILLAFLLVLGASNAPLSTIDQEFQGRIFLQHSL